MMISPIQRRICIGLVTLGFLVALSWLIPPLQSPDEMHHLGRAEYLSRGGLILLPPDASLSFRPETGAGSSAALVDASLLAFMKPYEQVILKAGFRFSEAEQAQIHAIPWSGQLVRYPVPGTGYYLPAIYAPHATGFIVGRFLDLSVVATYRVVRLICLVSTLAILGIALSVWRPNVAVCSILLLPMTLFQALSPVIDGLALSLAVLCLGLYVRGVRSDAILPQKLQASLVLLLAILVGSRIQLLPILLLPMHIAWVRRSRLLAAWALLGILGTCAWITWALTTTIDERIVREMSASELISYYLRHPVTTLDILSRTLMNATHLEFYWKSFIGILGWLDAPMKGIFYLLLSIGTATGIFLLRRRSQIPRKNSTSCLPLALAGCLSAGCVFLALLVAWTPYPAQMVEGVQGRYFAIPAIMLCFLPDLMQHSPRSNMTGGRLLFILVFALVSVVALVHTLQARYQTAEPIFRFFAN